MKYYLFIDESGDHGLVNIDQSFPVFVLCGILLSEKSYIELDGLMNSIKEEFWDGKKVIFHSRDIRKCQKEFQILLDDTIKQRFYQLINFMITSSSYNIIAAGIDKEKHIMKYGKLANNVYEIALSFLIERSIIRLDDFTQTDIELEIIIEQRGKKEDSELKEYFNILMQRGTYFVESKRFKKYQIKIDFRNKQSNINGLQLSDLLAYPIARYVMDKDRANPSFDILKSKFYTKNGEIFGLKVFP
jgi:hypothetical protein